MLTQKTQVNDTSVLTLDGELTIFMAGVLKTVLLDDPRPRVIDLSGVTEIDSAGVQLLMQSKKMALESQLPWRLEACSPAVLEVFALFNLFGYFEMPVPGVIHEY